MGKLFVICCLYVTVDDEEKGYFLRHTLTNMRKQKAEGVEIILMHAHAVRGKIKSLSKIVKTPTDLTIESIPYSLFRTATRFFAYVLKKKKCFGAETLL